MGNNSQLSPRLMAAIALTVLIGFASQACERSEPAKRWSLAEVRAEFEKLETPANAKPIEQVRTLKKYGVTSVSARYSVDISDVSLLEHYSKVFARDGWKFSRTVTGGGHFGDSYCKDKLLATVELFNSSPAAPIRYEFSVSWGQVSERKCP